MTINLRFSLIIFQNDFQHDSCFRILCIVTCVNLYAPTEYNFVSLNNKFINDALMMLLFPIHRDFINLTSCSRKWWGNMVISRLSLKTYMRRYYRHSQTVIVKTIQNIGCHTLCSLRVIGCELQLLYISIFISKK